MDLVSGHCDKVGAIANLETAKALHGIAQHQSPRLVRHMRNPGDRLGHPDLIIDHHHRDHERSTIELTFEKVEVEPAVALNRKDGEIDPLPCQPLAGVENRRMLTRQSDDPVAPARCLFNRSLKCPVQRFGGASCESDASPFRPIAFSTCLRATSIAASASRPKRDGECGLANFSSIQGPIALATSGATGVVAW